MNKSVSIAFITAIVAGGLMLAQREAAHCVDCTDPHLGTPGGPNGLETAGNPSERSYGR